MVATVLAAMAAGNTSLKGRARDLARPLRTRAGAGAARKLIAEAANGPVTAPPSAYLALVRELARDCHSVVDVGTGKMQSLELSPCAVKIGVEAHRPYLEHRNVHDAVPLNADALGLSDLFVPGAVDLVTMMDVIEHLEPADAAEAMAQMESIAAKRVVIATPRGFFEQDAHDVFEAGLGGEELQAHRSGWEVEDFTERGYRVAVIEGFHGADNAAFRRAYGEDAEPVDGLVAWREAR